VDRNLRQRYATGISSVDQAWDHQINLKQRARVCPVSPAAAAAADAWDALSELWTTDFSRQATPKQAADLANARVRQALNDASAAIGG
jgi:hypothetical protein